MLADFSTPTIFHCVFNILYLKLRARSKYQPPHLTIEEEHIFRSNKIPPKIDLPAPRGPPTPPRPSSPTEIMDQSASEDENPFSPPRDSALFEDQISPLPIKKAPFFRRIGNFVQNLSP